MNVLKCIIAHKDFEWTDLPKEKLNTYLAFSPNDIKTNVNLHKFAEVTGYDNRLVSELSHLKYIRDNINGDWIHINHYRRRLEVPDYNHLYCFVNTFNEHTNESFFNTCHNGTDLKIMTDIIQRYSPLGFQLEWFKMLSSNYLISYNMVSVPKYIFDEWIDISCMLLNEFKKIRGWNTYEDSYNYVITHRNEYSNSSDEYNARGLSYLWERITHTYFSLYAKNHNNFPIIDMPILMCNVKLLEPNQKI